jgi:hypothetical protein
MGAGLGGAYLHAIPNVQPLDLIVFCAGLLLGVRDGILIGGLTMLVYSLLNPYGAAPPLITLSQVVGEIGYGIGGGVLGHLGVERGAWWARVAILVLAALLLTVFFDLITTLATGLLFGQMRVTLLGGLSYSILHVAWNAALFASVGAPLAPVLARYRERLSH